MTIDYWITAGCKRFEKALEMFGKPYYSEWDK